MYLPISIIIPTLNEEKALPRLLTSILRQTFLPKEVIIADAKSKDSTRKIARSFGCKIIAGGSPAKGRNEGAKAANQELLLFLDADVVLPDDFLEKTTQEFFQRKLDVASCYAKPITKERMIKFEVGFMNSYHYLMKKIYPRVCGFCIFSKKKTFLKVNGFDESIYIGEDADFVNRAQKKGLNFNFLLSKKIPISVRRFSEEGDLRTSLKYVAIELYTMFIGKLRKPIFNYEFGHHVDL